MKIGAEQIEYGLEKGEYMAAKWNGLTIGEYAGRGIPSQTHQKAQNRQI